VLEDLYTESVLDQEQTEWQLLSTEAERETPIRICVKRWKVSEDENELDAVAEECYFKQYKALIVFYMASYVVSGLYALQIDSVKVLT